MANTSPAPTMAPRWPSSIRRMDTASTSRRRPGDYWVKEVTPPTGLTTAPAMLVAYTTSTQNCIVFEGKKTCKSDDDDSGGFTLAVIQDAPIGKPLPQTDAASVTGSASPYDTLWVVYAGLAGAIAAAAVLARGSRRRSLVGASRWRSDARTVDGRATVEARTRAGSR